MIELHPHPQPSLLPKRLRPLPPHPHPSLLPQIEKRIISQIKEQQLLFPSLVLLHPHWVADKSLMFMPPCFILFCFMVYLMYIAGPGFPKKKKMINFCQKDDAARKIMYTNLENNR